MMRILLMSLAMAAMGGCAMHPASRADTSRRPHPSPVAAEPAFYVPSTALVRAADAPPINPFAVVAGNQEESFFPRAEKAVLAPQPLYEASAYTLYTVDAQNISTPNGFGYRYRWIVRTGVTIP